MRSPLLDELIESLAIHADNFPGQESSEKPDWTALTGLESVCDALCECHIDSLLIVRRRADLALSLENPDYYL